MADIVDLLRQVDALQRQSPKQKPGESDEEFSQRIAAEHAATDEWIGALCYQGNSVSWTCSKAKNYGDSLLKVWDALREIGIPCDGNTHAADAIRKFAAKRTLHK